MLVFRMMMWLILFSKLFLNQFALLSFQACTYQSANHTMTAPRTGVTTETR